MTNVEVIKALRCGGHNMIFHYCDKEDCPYCQYSYHENLHRCNIQKLGADTADALEADENRIVELQKQVNEFIKNETRSTVIKVMSRRIAELEVQLPKEGEWLDETDGCYFWHGKCSICNYEYNIDSYYADMNYCPNCGAKMKFNGKQKTESKNTKSSLEYDYCGTSKRRYDIDARMKGE